MKKTTKKALKVAIILINLTVINLKSCPVCTDNSHNRAKPFFMDNYEASNNPRIEKIRQILEAMKSEQ